MASRAKLNTYLYSFSRVCAFLVKIRVMIPPPKYCLCVFVKLPDAALPGVMQLFYPPVRVFLDIVRDRIVVGWPVKYQLCALDGHLFTVCRNDRVRSTYCSQAPIARCVRDVQMFPDCGHILFFFHDIILHFIFL